MTITTRWYDADKTIACYDFVGAWTWEELAAAIAEIEVMLKSVPHRVDVIIDFSKSPGEPPRGILSHIRGKTLSALENWGGGVFVGFSPFLRVLFNTFKRLEPSVGNYYAIADNVEDARAVIMKRRAAQPETEA